MNTEQRLLEKWRTLSSERQKDLLEILDNFYQEETSKKETYIPQLKTPLAKKLWQLRLKALETQPPLRSWEELEQELAERRGERSEY